MKLESISENTKGALYIVLASALWSLGYFVRKIALHSISPLLLSLYTSLIAAVLLTSQYRSLGPQAVNSFKRNPLLFILLAISGPVFGSTLMYTGLSSLGLGMALLIERLQAVFTMFFAALFLKERLSYNDLCLGLTAILSSIMLSKGWMIIRSGATFSFVGIASVVAASACWGLAAVIGKELLNRQSRPEVLSMLRFVISSFLLSPFLFYTDFSIQPTLTLPLLGLLIGSAYFSTVIGYILYYKGLQRTDAGTSGFLELTTPISGLLLGFLFLGERLDGIQVTFSITLLCSIYFLVENRARTS